MSDLISRQEALEVINAVFPVDPMKSEYAQGIACGAALAKTYVEQLPSAQQWIPCSERLPETPDMVLVTIDWGDGDYEVSTDEYWSIDGVETEGWGNTGGPVIAWMSLPEPYKGDEK